MNAAEPPVIRCVGAVVHDHRGRLLLVLRANEPGQGLWSLPGGKIEPGESERDAVRREVREETGLSVTVGAELGRLVRRGTQSTYDIADYSCRATESTLFPGDDAADAVWADRATFTTLATSGALTRGLVECLEAWDSLPREH